MLAMLNHILGTAPSWTDAGHTVGLVGVPINALFDWPMATRAGFAVFQDPKVNAMLKKVLNVWNEFLASPESANVLGTDKEGWFGESGKESILQVANVGGTNKSFEELFQCDPKAKHHGYKSWDDFFTRLFRFDEGIRPVAEPENDDVVANCCESKTYKIAHDIKARDKFWVKGQPYSVVDMLAQDPLAEQFVGGTIYQAFLSALSYHRWHTPVSGTIKKAYVVDGAYFSEPLFEDFTSEHPADKNGECTSQEYISVVATRSIIFIEADNPKIGLMCFMGIGMTEVSTCETTVKEGQHVNKGDQLG
jgi:phosphatidylserine decarboxylase